MSDYVYFVCAAVGAIAGLWAAMAVPESWIARAVLGKKERSRETA